MTVLVADVGGTNTRLARLTDAGHPSHRSRFANDDFPRFTDVVESYETAGISSCVIAIAGPVTRDRARLTNRDWHFDRAEIADRLGLRSARDVMLMNDLAALGYGLPDLAPDQLLNIRPGKAGASNGQALVVGLGTGFNAALVKQTPAGPVVIEAELGHACPPASVSAALERVWGNTGDRFATNEDIFSGRGLSRAYEVATGKPERNGAKILDAVNTDPAAKQAVCLIGELLGLLTRELTYMYLPFDGIYFAGGAARGLMSSMARSHFLTSLNAPGVLTEQMTDIPVRLIADDAAALAGIARLAVQVGFLPRVSA